jgi:hypothetical protein
VGGHGDEGAEAGELPFGQTPQHVVLLTDGHGGTAGDEGQGHGVEAHLVGPGRPGEDVAQTEEGVLVVLHADLFGQHGVQRARS